MMRRFVFGLVALGLLAGGCGYSLRGSLPSHIRTIAIPVFANKTQEPAVESLASIERVAHFGESARRRCTCDDGRPPPNGSMIDTNGHERGPAAYGRPAPFDSRVALALVYFPSELPHQYRRR